MAETETHIIMRIFCRTRADCTALVRIGKLVMRDA
jgi:hypothetical protein